MEIEVFRGATGVWVSVPIDLAGARVHCAFRFAASTIRLVMIYGDRALRGRIVPSHVIAAARGSAIAALDADREPPTDRITQFAFGVWA